jgi:hypothetical protein
MQDRDQMEPIMLRPLLAALVIFAAPATSLAADCDPAFAAGLPQAVSQDAVAAVDDSYDIEFWEFCRGREFRDLGNAATLTRTIAANPYLIGPIEQKGWRADDVKFVRIANGRIDLWLHRDP